MTRIQATAEVFLIALRALPEQERIAVPAGIADDAQLREDILDLALLTQRRHEPSRSFREYLAEKRKCAPAALTTLQ